MSEVTLHNYIFFINSIFLLQAGLVQEVECLKDQLDILREQTHTHRKYDQVIQR